MRRLDVWFRNLKKWQKGGLIGCAVGLFFVCLTIVLFFTWRFPPSIILPPSILHILYALPVTMIVLELIGMLNFVLCIAFIYTGSYTGSYIGSVALVGGIIVFYCVFGGAFGAIVGRVQQVTSPFWRRLLTALLALLALFLLFAYLFSFEFIRSFE